MDTPALNRETKHLFTPGPVMVPEEVRQVVKEPDIGHRRPQFEAILESVRGKILDLYQASNEYTSVVVSGSGTAANETVLNSLSDQKILIVQNGEFGNRLENISNTHNIEYDTLTYNWGETPDISEIESTLTRSDFDMVAMTYQETSTSMINPVTDIGNISSEHNVDFYVDAISAVGSEPIDVDKENIDIITGVSNKAVGSLTGCSFICLRRDLIDEIDTNADSVYLNLEKHVQYADKYSQTPNTPAVTSIAALDVALEVLFSKEGYNQRISRYKNCSALLRDEIKKIDGLELLLEPEKMSNTLTSVYLPEDIDLSSFIDELDDRGYIVYPGKGPLYDQGVFQIGNMGEIYESDCYSFLHTLETALNELGFNKQSSLA